MFVLSLIFPLTLLGLSSTIFLFPIAAPDYTAEIALVLSTAFISGYYSSRYTSKTLLPLPYQLITTLFVVLELVAGKERSEFLHFETAPPIDLPFSHLFILLAILVTIDKLKRKSVIILGLALFMSILAHLLFSWGDEYSIAFLPVTVVSLFVLIGSYLSFEPTKYEIQISLIGILLFTSFTCYLFIDAALRTQNMPRCGHASLQPPEVLVQLLLTAEDPRFYSHYGIDLHRLRMAARETIQSGKYGRGGSTLSMQYAKICYLPHEKTLMRKLRQLPLAVILERKHTKSELISRYLTSIPFGESVDGIQDASEYYFSKPLGELTVDQHLALIMTVFDPSSFNPHIPPNGKIRARKAVIKSRFKQVYRG